MPPAKNKGKMRGGGYSLARTGKICHLVSAITSTRRTPAPPAILAGLLSQMAWEKEAGVGRKRKREARRNRKKMMIHPGAAGEMGA